MELVVCASLETGDIEVRGGLGGRISIDGAISLLDSDDSGSWTSF